MQISQRSFSFWVPRRRLQARNRHPRRRHEARAPRHGSKCKIISKNLRKTKHLPNFVQIFRIWRTLANLQQKRQKRTWASCETFELGLVDPHLCIIGYQSTHHLHSKSQKVCAGLLAKLARSLSLLTLPPHHSTASYLCCTFLWPSNLP